MRDLGVFMLSLQRCGRLEQGVQVCRSNQPASNWWGAWGQGEARCKANIDAGLPVPSAVRQLFPRLLGRGGGSDIKISGGIAKRSYLCGYRGGVPPVPLFPENFGHADHLSR